MLFLSLSFWFSFVLQATAAFVIYWKMKGAGGLVSTVEERSGIWDMNIPNDESDGGHLNVGRLFRV